MASRELSRPYEPNPLLRALYQRFFDRIQVDEAWVDEVRRLSAQGTVVYILRSLNFMDFFALDHLTKRHQLPQIRFVNDLGLWILNPMGRGWLNAMLPRSGADEAAHLEDALSHGGGSAALFLKRPPGMLQWASGASAGRGLKQDDDLVRTLFQLQRQQEAPILLVPQVFVWTKLPESSHNRLMDLFLGPREWPTPARTIGQFLYNYKHVALRLGEPLDLAEFLRTSNGASDDQCVRRVTYAMLRRLERERRAITGPDEKPPDRVRHEIVRSPKLRAVIADLAGDRASDRQVLTGRALDHLRKLQATPEVATLKGLEVLLHRVFHRIYAGIEYELGDIERLRAASRKGTLVLLPSHKSHVDYLILSYIFNEQNLPLPLIAAGDNLDFFPVGPIFRRAGAFFIRRSFAGDRLYTAAVDAYIRRLLRDGYPIEMFLEGGRSRTGKLLPPKFGLLNMVVDAALSLADRSTFFVPVSIGYERVIESQSYQRELRGAAKQKEDATGLLRSSELLKHRYGRINLQVGQVLTLDELARELAIPRKDALRPAKRRALVTRLGNRVMDEINRVTAVTPGALTALAVLIHPQRGIAHAALVESCRRLLGLLQSMGARATPFTRTPSGALRPEAIREAAQMFVDAELLEAHFPDQLSRDLEPRRARARRRRGTQAGDHAIYTVVDKKRLELDTSKNIIVHFLVERALVAIAILSSETAQPDTLQVRSRVYQLSRLFKYEFRFRADRSFDEIFDETLNALIALGTLRQQAEELSPGPGSDGWDGHSWLSMYAATLQNFVEGYRVAARALSFLVKAPHSEAELVKKALSAGQRMYLAGEIARTESISKPLIQNAFLAFGDEGYLQRQGDKFVLAESFNATDTVGAVEGRLSGFLVKQH